MNTTKISVFIVTLMILALFATQFSFSSTILDFEKNNKQMFDADGDTLLLRDNEGELTEDDFDIASYTTRVIDGDTIELESGKMIRLSIVDTPEIGEPGYREAKELNKDLCLNQETLIDIDDKQDNSYDRIVAAVFCSDGYFLNKILLNEGYAVVLERYCDDDKSEFSKLLC